MFIMTHRVLSRALLLPAHEAISSASQATALPFVARNMQQL
jgi:hypothetical protein